MRFMACTAFPKCRNAKPLPEELKAKTKAGAATPGPEEKAPEGVE